MHLGRQPHQYVGTLAYAGCPKVLVAIFGHTFGHKSWSVLKAADDKTFQEHEPVIIATVVLGGGLTPDLCSSSTVPDLSNLPTTMGSHFAGGCLKMSMCVGAERGNLE